MPRVDPAELETLPLHAGCLVDGFELHDVWCVELDGTTELGLPELRRRITAARLRDVNPLVLLLFAIRSAIGTLFRLDTPGRRPAASELVAAVPPELASRSAVPPGTADGPFTVLYMLPEEAAYEALNRTVHAILIVALTATDAGTRLYWVTYLEPVGRITALYMGLIDPFRRAIVYPGLERAAKRWWSEERDAEARQARNRS